MGVAPGLMGRPAAEGAPSAAFFGRQPGVPALAPNENEVKQMARCVIVSAGSLEAGLRRLLQPGDVVIACDAGYCGCEKLGVRPDIILGDFDSAPRPDQPDVVVLPHVKDDTDTHYAARLAAEKGFSSVLLLGALGGRRIEHTLANLSTGLWLARQGIDAVLADENSRITYVRPGTPRRYRKGEYLYLSVVPAEGRAGGVCIRGAFYPLENAVLTSEYPLGVSNEFVQPEIEVSCQTGFLLVIETLADE